MSLTVTRATVKRKCRISITDFDSEIDDLISEQLPAIEFSVLPNHIADTGNSGLQATLNLGAAEVIAGEFMAQAYREPGAGEELRFLDMTIGQRPPYQVLISIADPFGIKKQGWARLAPYLKPVVASYVATRIGIRSKEKKLTENES